MIVKEWKGKYIKDVTEYLLSCSAETIREKENQLPVGELQPLTPQMARMQIGEQQVRAFTAKLLNIVRNAHWDDIHSLKRLSDNTIISGSKDNTISKWSVDGRLIKVVQDVEPFGVDPKDWITALCQINDQYWVSGERNGHVYLWNTAGDFIKELPLKRPINGQHVSLPENSRRVNCLAAGTDKQNATFFAGFPTIFDEYSLIEGRTVRTNFVHKNDWVFCIQPLDSKRILTATGATLEMWDRGDKQWQRGSVLEREVKTKNGKQRPFISSLTPLKESSNQFAMSVFGGSVKLADIHEGKIVKEWNEHSKRVWAVESIARDLFASSAEDETIKFWDVREKNSLHTIKSEFGQTHTLLSLGDHSLVAGHHLDHPKNKNEGATLAFYDIRR